MRTPRFLRPNGFLLSVALVAGAGAALAEEPVRPNVVVVLLDNVGREWFGCYGSEESCTPEIDKLAATGVRFENCYTPTVCGPSRVQLLTGRYPFRTGWYLHHDAALYSGGGLDGRRETTFARVFRAAGYATGIAGKWQVNNLYDEPDALRQHGFDEHLVWPGSIDRKRVDAEFLRSFQAHIAACDSTALAGQISQIESRYWDPVLLRNRQRETHPGKFGPDLVQDFACRFIERHREHPFLLYYPMLLAHGATFVAHTVLTPANQNAPPADEKGRFADMLRYADAQIGALVRTLEAAGVRRRTYLLVISDNGSEPSLVARSSGRLVQGGLYKITEAGGNVALIANAPTLVAGPHTAALADTSDLFPTLCDLAGLPPPAGVTLDGRSFAGFLRGTAAPPRQWIFNEYLPDRVIRDRRFKLYSDGRFFDLAFDPDEQRPLSPTADGVAGESRRNLQRILESLPTDTPPGFPHRSLSAFKLRASSAAAKPQRQP